MAYLQARSGIARSGVTYCGWTPPSVTCYIGGTDRTSSVLRQGWNLTARADGTPPTFSFRTKTITPTAGQNVLFAYATPNDYLFGGTILQRQAVPVSNGSSRLEWECTAVGYQWLMDRFDRVNIQYWSTGVGTMVADILDRFTDGGFRVGYIPSSLGNLDMTFTFETAWAALQRIAKACGGVLEVTPEKIVNIYTSYPEAALASATQATILGKSFTYREDLTQVRTRSLFEGQSTTVSSFAAVGATTIAVNDASIFDSSGGTARSGRNVVTYTGLTATTGAGVLTGVIGILYDITSNDTISVFIEAEDTAAQTALATILGGGLSGQATNYLQDGRLSISEATARANADLDVFGGSLQEAQFTNKTPNRYVRAGRSITLAVTDPLTVSGSFTIQGVTLTPYGAIGGTRFEAYQSLEVGSFTRRLTDILRQLKG